MDERDEQLLQQFFSEKVQQTIADDGFTERVMNRLPKRVKTYTRLWTAFCVLMGVVLFTVFHGWQLLLVYLEVFLRTTIVEPPHINPVMVAFVFSSILMIIVYEVLSYERVFR